MLEGEDMYTDYVSFASGLVSICSSLIVLVGILCVYLRKKTMILKCLAKELGESYPGKVEFNRYIKKFNTYAAHRLVIYSKNNEVLERNITAKEWGKQFKANSKSVSDKVTIIFGEPGAGKTFLMKYLYFCYCYYNFKKESNESNHVVFIQASRYNNAYNAYERLIKDIECVCCRKEVKILFLDGLDEFICFEKSITNNFNLLFKMLNWFDENDILFKLDKIFISSRMEQYDLSKEKLIVKIQEYQMRPSVAIISPFDAKQIRNLYKKIGGSIEDHVKAGKHLGILNRYLKSTVKGCECGIFSNPFFINYADQLLESWQEKKEVFKVGEPYFIIIDKWIEKEWERYWRKHSNMSVDETYNKEIYRQTVYKSLEKLCEQMINSKKSMIELEDLESIANKLFVDKAMESESKDYFLTRHLLRSLNIKGKNSPVYEFIHYLFFEFLVAKLFIENLKISYKDRCKYLNTDLQIKKFYIYHLYQSTEINNHEYCYIIKNYLQSFRENIECSYLNEKTYYRLKSIDDFERLFIADGILFSDTLNVSLNVELILLPNIKWMRYKEFFLDKSQIEDFLIHQFLCLSHSNIHHIDGIRKFTFLKGLHLTGNAIEDIEDIVYLEQLTELYLFDMPNGLVIDPVKKMHLKVLGIDVGDVGDDLLDILQCKNVENFIVDPKGSISIYEDIYKERKKGKSIFLRKPIERKYLYENGGFVWYKNSRLEAIYRMEMEDFFGKRIFDERCLCIPHSFNKLDTLDCGRRLIQFFLLLKDYKKAEEMAYEIYEEYFDIFGEMGELTLSTQLDLCDILRETERYEEAEYILEKNYINCVESLGQYHYLSLRNQKNLGQVLNLSGKYEKAEIVLRRNYTCHLAVLGKAHADTLISQYLLGKNMSEMGKYDEAEKVLMDNYESALNVFGESHLFLFKIQFLLGKTLCKREKYEQAKVILRRNYINRLEKLGEHDEDTLESQHWLEISLNGVI